jgi:DNA polymerase (family 10)
MKNKEVAAILSEIADLLEILDVRWEPNAYRKAARTIESLNVPIEGIYDDGGVKGLKELPGIGETISKNIEEYLKKGKIKKYSELQKKIPKGVDEMLHIMGLGPKKAWALHKKLKINSLKDLEKAAKNKKIRTLPGFGEKTELEILDGIKMDRVKKSRHYLIFGLETAREIQKQLKKLPYVKTCEIAGSVRRMKETIADIDLLVSTNQPEKVMDFVQSLDGIKKTLAKGKTKTSIILESKLQVDVRVIEPKSFGAAMQYFTGSKEHNVKVRNIAIKKGYKLNEYGLFTKRTDKYVAGKTEAEVYKRLGLPNFPPELRENLGEIQAKKLPTLIEYGDIQGDVHMHSNWSDGNNSIDEMVKAAKKLKYKYVAITDHSVSTRIANGLNEQRLLGHSKEIDKVQKKNPGIKVLKGSEVDIKWNGKLDYKPAILKQLDVVMASVHQNFKMPKTEMTKRLLTAINSGHVTGLSHPTGRKVNVRKPYEFDYEKVFQACADNDVFLEINASPSRLDLNDQLIRLAKEFKAKFLINTDAHDTNHLRFIELGVGQARRGWLEKKDVINTLPKAQFLKKIKR